MIDEKDTLELLKIAKWDCNKVEKFEIEDPKIRYLVKKFPKKFKKIGKLLIIKGTNFNQSQLKKLAKIDENIMKSVIKCKNCGPECKERKEKRDEAIRKIIDMYEGIGWGLIKMKIDSFQRDDVQQIIHFSICESIKYFDFSKNNKFSTLVYTFLNAHIIEHFNIQKYGKIKKQDVTLLNLDDAAQTRIIDQTPNHNIHVYDISEYTKILNSLEKVVINCIYNNSYHNEELIKDLKKISSLDEESIKKHITIKNDHKFLSKVLKVPIFKVKEIESFAIKKIKDHHAHIFTKQ